MSAGLVWLQIHWSKVCSTNSLCNMSKDKLASNYLADILFIFTNAWMAVLQRTSVTFLHSCTLILSFLKTSHFLKVSSIDILMMPVFYFRSAVMCEMTLWLWLLLSWFNSSQKMRGIQWQDIKDTKNKILTFSPWKTWFCSLIWLKIVGLHFNSSQRRHERFLKPGKWLNENNFYISN